VANYKDMIEDEMRYSNFKKGYRVTVTCENCGVHIYSRSSGQKVNCKCANLTIEENPYNYRVTEYSACEYKQTMILYKELRD